jgi:hypothetical protein
MMMRENKKMEPDVFGAGPVRRAEHLLDPNMPDAEYQRTMERLAYDACSALINAEAVSHFMVEALRGTQSPQEGLVKCEVLLLGAMRKPFASSLPDIDRQGIFNLIVAHFLLSHAQRIPGPSPHA